MPRGVRGSGKPRKSVDERIGEIDKAIDVHKKEIAALMVQRKALLKDKKNENKDELIKVVAESKLTPDQLRELINKVKN